MAQLLTAATGKRGTEDAMLASQGRAEAWNGRLKNARDLMRGAMDSAERNDAKESAAVYQAQAALREVEFGNRSRAREDANAAFQLAPSRDVRAMAALALARAGDTAEADKLVAELDKMFPLDVLVQRYWLPTIRAAIALDRKDPNQAVELLKKTSQMELGTPTSVSVSLCPVFVRGVAYLALRDGKHAAAEFQKFIDHRGVVSNFSWAQSRGWNWHVQMHSLPNPSKVTKPKPLGARPAQPTWISSPAGKTPSPIFQSCARQKRSTRNSNDCLRSAQMYCPDSR